MVLHRGLSFGSASGWNEVGIDTGAGVASGFGMFGDHYALRSVLPLKSDIPDVYTIVEPQ